MVSRYECKVFDGSINILTENAGEAGENAGEAGEKAGDAGEKAGEAGENAGELLKNSFISWLPHAYRFNRSALTRARKQVMPVWKGCN
jgi:hypothetical protein